MPSDVWPGAEDPPFLPSKDDDACQGAPAWTAELHAADLLRALRAAGFRGELRDVRIASRNALGRVARLRLDGLRPDRDLRPGPARRGRAHAGLAAHQEHGVRSAEAGRRLPVQRPRVRSRRRHVRHRLGAARRAGRGPPKTSLRAISPASRSARLGASAPTTTDAAGASIADDAAPARPPCRRQTPGPSGTGVLSVTGRRWRSRCRTKTKAATPSSKSRRSRARRAGRRARRRAASRDASFPPDDRRLRAATGQPWFTSGAIVNDELHLLPLAVLRDRGVLDRTIRHELVHLMVDGPLKDRPAWVREGARSTSRIRNRRRRSKPSARRARPTTSCVQPVSVGALSNAYARAKACFARQIQFRTDLARRPMSARLTSGRARSACRTLFFSAS